MSSITPERTRELAELLHYIRQAPVDEMVESIQAMARRCSRYEIEEFIRKYIIAGQLDPKDLLRNCPRCQCLVLRTEEQDLPLCCTCTEESS